jgi:hypothetical protein
MDKNKKEFVPMKNWKNAIVCNEINIDPTNVTVHRHQTTLRST